MSKSQKKKIISNHILLTGLKQFNDILLPLRLKHAPLARITASETVSRRLGLSNYWARQLRAQAVCVYQTSQLQESHQGQGAFHESLLNNPTVDRKVREYVSSIETGKLKPSMLCRFVNYELLPDCSFSKKSISEKTARKWMAKLGFMRVEVKKGIYYDGHEREDVIAARTQFLKQMAQLQKQMIIYDDKTLEPTQPKLLPGEKIIHLIMQDESCFHANDQSRFVYVQNGEQPLRSKSRGRIVHVSDFILEADGYLQLNDDQVAHQETLPVNQRLPAYSARQLIYPGSGHDPWWDMSQLVAQVQTTIQIFDYLHPNSTAAFTFDCSSAHEAFPKDALVAHEMNVSPGGKQPIMHDTIIPMNNPDPNLRGKPQSMVFTPGHEHAGQPKGMQIILEERGLLGTISVGRNGKPVGRCNFCKLSQKKKDMAMKEARSWQDEIEGSGIEGGLAGVLDEHSGLMDHRQPDNCCMERCLSLQQDFLEQKPLLQTVIEEAGHMCLFLPKFHCELNPIELLWGWAKRIFREHADGSFPTAKRLVPTILDSCDVKTIRRFFRKSWRFMDAYHRLQLNGRQAQYAVHDYKSHRRCPGAAMDDPEEAEASD